MGIFFNIPLCLQNLLSIYLGLCLEQKKTPFEEICKKILGNDCRLLI